VPGAGFRAYWRTSAIAASINCGRLKCWSALAIIATSKCCLREGLITEAEVHGHPMRNYVECCLGGDAALPEMSISTRRKLKSGDVLLLCTDGLWANLRDHDFRALRAIDGKPLRESLTDLGTRRSRLPLLIAITPVRRRCAGGQRE